MIKLLKLTLLTTAILLMQGCASHEKFVQKYDSWVGKNISHLIAKIGYPDSTFTLPSKHKVYVYERSRVYSIPSFPMMGYGYGGAYGMFSYAGNEVVQESCKLFIETNKKGNILKWGSRGNHCVSN
jgi:hypothetical protein